MFVEYDLQAGGHCKLLRLQHEPSMLVKPTKSENEAGIYQCIQNPRHRLHVLKSVTIPDVKWDCHERPSSEEVPSEEGATGNRHFAFPMGKSVLLMKDLLYNFEQPSAIDFKMGILQNTLGNEKPGKIRKQIAKSLSSTSAQLGFRICGLRIYNEKGHDPLLMDKYAGRQITVYQLQPFLRQCFSFGGRLQKSLLEFVIEQLQRLRTDVEALDGFRFWGSSVLIYWDSSKPDTKRGLRLIDFANTAELSRALGPDWELQFGLKNLEGLLREVMLSSSD